MAIPVNGSATALMSGTVRTRPPRLPGAHGQRARHDAALVGGLLPQQARAAARRALLALERPRAPLLAGEIPVDQPVSKSRGLPCPMPSVVPPTAVAYGSLDGTCTPEASPLEKSMLTPSAAALTR